MDAARRARSAARDHVEDISPPRLAAAIEDRLGAASMVPGVLTLLSARAVATTGPGNAPSPPGDAVERRAAGVQLIYEGLSLTRSLVAENPWSDAAAEPGAVPADLDVLAADILVARGFSLLARTDAARPAVETVRAFGREQTDSLAGRSPTAQPLEANVFELAAVAGATAAGHATPPPLRQYAVGLARANPETPLAPAPEFFPDTVEEVLRRVSEPRARERPAPQSPD
ncbi:MAG: hypothetical protein ABEH77_01185 [Halobacteriaceae archaeon]